MIDSGNQFFPDRFFPLKKGFSFQEDCKDGLLDVTNLNSVSKCLEATLFTPRLSPSSARRANEDADQDNSKHLKALVLC